MKRVNLIIALFFVTLTVKAQDVQFSQFYAAPLYLNPAFAGSSEMTRFGVNYRNQWPGLDHSFNAYSAYIDHYLFNINSGVGLIVNGMQETMAGSSTMEVGFSYAYRLQLGYRSFLRFGGQASYFSRDANFGHLVFNSQINQGTGNIGDYSGENLPLDIRHRYMDYHFGALYNNESVWFGLSAHHITQPNISYLEEGYARWPLKLSMHGGLKFKLTDGFAPNLNKTSIQKELVLAFNYKHQDPFNQLDLGVQMNVQPLVLGVWYRGLPNLSGGIPNNESLIGLLGISFDSGIDIGYSYDFTLSRLGQANTGGAHEISMRFAFLPANHKKTERKTSLMPCFKY